MKHNYFKHLFTTLLLLCTMVATAHDFEVDGIYYNIKDAVNKTVEVTYKGISYAEYFDEYTGSIVIPDIVVHDDVVYSVASIGNDAFKICTDITSIKIPNTVTSIGSSAFYGCTGLKEIYVFSAKPATITSKTFNDYSATLYVPGGVKSAYEKDTCWAAFTNITEFVDKDLEFTITSEEDATVTVTGYTGNQSTVAIPSHYTIDGKSYTVTSIGNYAFYECSSLTSITIPNSVTSIGNRAFEGCTGLKVVHISDLAAWCGIDFIGINPLYYANKLYMNGELVTDLIIPDDVIEIKDYAFKGCTSLTSIVIGDGVTKIGEQVFNGCSGLTSIVIPNSVTSIGSYAFKGCTSLKNLRIEDGEGVLYLGTNLYSVGFESGRGLFSDCPLETLYLGRDLSYCSDYNYGYSPFEKINSLTSLIIGNSVTNIENCAFRYCTGLTSVTIPNSVTSIRSDAFRSCTGLANIDYNAEDCYLLKNSFYGCTALETVRIGEKVKAINSGLDELRNNTGLTSIIVAEENSVYDSRNNCNAIIETVTNTLVAGCESTVIPNNITSVGESTFRYCTGLTSITIPNSVTSIGNYAFFGCSSLTSITIPNSVTSIGTSAFKGCTSLTSITIPNSVTSIGNYAFSSCAGLTSITIPNSVTYIGESTFYGCSGLTSIEIPNSVTRIGEYAFKGCKKLETAVIGKGIESILYSVFADCENLSDVYCFASSVPSTISNAFENSYIEYATLHVPEESTDSYKSTEPWSNFGTIKAIVNEPTTINGVTYKFDIVEKSATVTANENGSYTGNVVIPETVKKNDTIYRVTTIGERAFAGCTNLTSITIPSSINIIEGDAFEECNGLTAVHISDLSAWCKIWIKTSHFTNPLFYAHNLYLNGKLVTDLVIPDDITEIKAYTFQSCNNFTSVTIPNHIIKIGQWAFYRCCGLQSITIPNSVTDINLNAFDGCSGLESITVESGNTRYDSRENCNAIIETTTNTLIAGCKNTVIPNSVTSIGIHAFYGCTGLTSIEIPNSVTSIGESTFSGCKGLTSITIPNSVTSIGIYAFEGCTGLSNIYLTSVVPPSISPYSFTNTQYKNAVLYVPQGTLATYQTADNWKNFTNITELVNEDLEFTITSEEDATVAISGYTGNKSIVTIPSHCTIDGKSYNVTSIGNRAFNGCTGLISIEIPNSITSIGNQAFYGCTSLTSVVIPNSITRIGGSAFNGCTSLTNVVIPNSITSIGNGAFEGCTGLTSVEFNAENCTTMGRLYSSPVFGGCTALSTITIGEAVKTIPEGAFCGCVWLTSVISYIPAGNLFTIDYFCDYDVYPACTLYVPNGAKEKYASTHEWDFFGVIVEMNTSGITLNRKTVILTEGETTALVTIVSIDGATGEDIIWSTSDSAVATVKNGLVTAIAPGSATITATVDGNSDSCVVTVAIPATSLRELNNNTVYCICQPHHSKGATSWAVETDSNVLKSNVDLGIEMNIDDCRQQFAILSGDGGNTYFLYHVAEGKFICKDGTLSETPVDAINFMDGAYNGTFFAYFDSSHYVNVGGSRQMTIDKWNTPDGGNSCRLQPVGEFDPTEALEAIHNFTGIEEIKGEMRNEKGEIYDLRGRKLSEITAPGIYIIDGKKVLVK